jgi:hypothetical protein
MSRPVTRAPVRMRRARPPRRDRHAPPPRRFADAAIELDDDTDPAEQLVLQPMSDTP